MTRFRILQIKDIAACDYAFRGYKEDKFNIEDYEVVYVLESETMDDKSDLEALEVLFYIFNIYLICRDLRISPDIPSP